MFAMNAIIPEAIHHNKDCYKTWYGCTCCGSSVQPADKSLAIGFYRAGWKCLSREYDATERFEYHYIFECPGCGELIVSRSSGNYPEVQVNV